MQLTIKGKNVEVTDTLRQYVEKKIGKLDRYLPNIDEARVELSTENTKSASDRQVVQVTIRSRRTILRAEERSSDMLAAIDAVADKMVQRINRFKGKRRNRGRGAPAEAVPASVEEAEEEHRIVRVKRFPVIPMDEEEAIEQMELLGHDFFVFYNVNDDAINVLYRRRDGNYGLIQPELS
ncbi:MAG: ribosome-associated translation inhibitor RaiA [Anaerolineae bacterium]|nr:ribosome-associated translation inhibitor RaiA [Anaerolineae bacterium]